MAGSGREHTFLVRLSGEIGIKARVTHARFRARLADNLRDALRSSGLEGRVRSERNRIVVECNDADAGPLLARVFGVQSVSPVERRVPQELPAIVEAGKTLFRERVAGRRFAVRARHVGDHGRGGLRARDIEIELGAALLPHAARVDLGDPELTARVELFDDEAWLFAETIPGPGGLPLGVEGRAIALVSGGFDSAVAAWRILRRGVALDYVFCNLGGVTHQQGVMRVMKVIADRWSYGTSPRLHAVDFDALSRGLQRTTTPRYWQIVLKRLMLRAGEAVAHERRADALVTGESVGQVSSQTLRNLAAISSATTLPILRPLVGFNKEEIVAEARHVGTHDLSAVVAEYCALVPSRPATGAAVAAIDAEEEKLDDELLRRALAEHAVFDLRSLDPDKGAIPELEIETVPEGAVVLDLRSRAAYQGWHWPDALFLDFAHALEAYRSFDRDKTYVLYCEFGLKSAHLAELLQREGVEAFNFRGGLKALLRHAEEKGLAPIDLLGKEAG